MKLYRQDIKIAGTVYVVAENEEEAERLIHEQCYEVGCDLRCDDFVSDVPFDELLEAGPSVTLSPAITMKGTFEGEFVEEVD